MAVKKGYSPSFIGKKLSVSLPELNNTQQSDVAPIEGEKENLLNYVNYSLKLSKKRRFPFFTATNINGKLFKSIARKELFNGGSDRWVIDKRAVPYQWGDELYTAEKSDFHRGHMTKREDPQWGTTKEEAVEGALSTFFFSNSVPQVAELNAREWASLETYLLKKEAQKNKLKINLFTGPVLSENDPLFVTKIKGQDVQIPTLFWKVIYFTPDGKTLKRVAFLMGQKDLLLKREIAKPKPKDPELEGTKAPVVVDPLFIDFKNAATYQVTVSTIERLTGLKFPEAEEPFTDDRKLEIVVKKVEVDDALEGNKRGIKTVGDELDFELEGLVL